MPPELPDPAETPDPAKPGDDVGTEPADQGGSASGATPAPPEQPVAVQPAEPVESATVPGEVADAEHRANVRRLITLAVAAVILIAVAVLLAFANHAARANGPLSNQAFIDTGSTSAVVGEMTAAIKTVYSYDYRTLDANQTAARAVTTGEFSQSFDKVFDAVKQLAPKEQAVMTTTVPAAGVIQLQGDRARLLMMVDQNGTRAGAQPISGSSARLIVQAHLVDGHWKIAEVTPE